MLFSAATKARSSPAEPLLLFAAIRSLRITRQTAGVWLPLHERRNGQFVLQATGHQSYGLSWGQDRLVPAFLATLATRQKSPRITFESAAQLLDTLRCKQGSTQYRLLVGAFQRLFGATIFFGIDSQRERAAIVHLACFNL